MPRKQMTVKELIEALQKFNVDLRVNTEGCDCVGQAYAVVEKDGEVLITREYSWGRG